MSTPALKRRKLDGSDALSRPFKSPMRTPIKQAKPSDAEGSSSPTLEVKPLLPAPSFSSLAKSSPARACDPEAVSLQRQLGQSISHTMALQAELDTVTQALKIQASSKDAELDRLVGVWKAASRDAAEYLFGGVKDRVNRMGGVAAWRERERERRSTWEGGWDEGEEKQKGNGDDAQDDEGSAERVERLEREKQEDERAKGGENDEDTGFTMGMMLASLNIDPSIIGYDDELERWIDERG